MLNSQMCKSISFEIKLTSLSEFKYLYYIQYPAFYAFLCTVQNSSIQIITIGKFEKIQTFRHCIIIRTHCSCEILIYTKTHKTFFHKHNVYIDILHIDDVYFTTWASWGACSSGCEGQMYKTRDCQEADIALCESSTNVSISCEPQLCPGEWVIS